MEKMRHYNMFRSWETGVPTDVQHRIKLGLIGTYDVTNVFNFNPVTDVNR